VIDLCKLNVSLRVASESELEMFKTDLQEAFKMSAESEFGGELNEPIPSDSDIEESFAAVGSVIYHVLVGNNISGGAVVSIDEKTQHNTLLLFFIKVGGHDRGLGSKAWTEIEKMHPETEVWETVTPYFEKRNIHFYVNKCGFKIVEFYNRYHPDPNQRPKKSDEEDEMFKFQKIMKIKI